MEVLNAMAYGLSHEGNGPLVRDRRRNRGKPQDQVFAKFGAYRQAQLMAGQTGPR